jgi:hypothetical protein
MGLYPVVSWGVACRCKCHMQCLMCCLGCLPTHHAYIFQQCSSQSIKHTQLLTHVKLRLHFLSHVSSCDFTFCHTCQAATSLSVTLVKLRLHFLSHVSSCDFTFCHTCQAATSLSVTRVKLRLHFLSHVSSFFVYAAFVLECMPGQQVVACMSVKKKPVSACDCE